MFSPEFFNSMRVICPASNFSIANVRITCTTVSFNLNTASELHYPERVSILAAEDGSILTIVPWAPNGNVGIAYAVPFFDKSVRPTPKRITVRDKNFARRLRKTCGWDKDKLRREAYGLYDPDYNLVYFDLSNAVLASEKKQKNSLALGISDYPSFSQVVRASRPMLALPASDADPLEVPIDYIIG